LQSSAGKANNAEQSEDLSLVKVWRVVLTFFFINMQF
jgi:hypothetical protein